MTRTRSRCLLGVAPAPWRSVASAFAISVLVLGVPASNASAQAVTPDTLLLSLDEAYRIASQSNPDLPPRVVPHPMLVPAPVEGREGRASSGTRATA